MNASPHLLSYDVLDPGSPLLAEKPEVSLNEDRLKDLALQHASLYVPLRSQRGVREAITEGALSQDDVIPDSLAGASVEDIIAIYARYFRISQARLSAFLQPLPAQLNPTVSRHVFRGLEYGAGSQLPGFPEIDLWITSINNAILHKNIASYWSYERTRETRGQRARMLAAWLWVHSAIPTITSSPLLFETMREFITLNLSLNAQVLRTEAPILEQARAWADAFLNPGPSVTTVARIEPDAVSRVAPDCTTLSWDEIFWLREREGFAAYLARLESVRAAATPQEAQAAVDRISREQDALVCQLHPSPVRTIWQGILGELIGRFIPFWGIADASRQAIGERRTNRQYAATFWLAEARTKAASAKQGQP